MLQPKTFTMENPQEIFPAHFMIRLTINPQYIDFIKTLPYVAQVEDFTIAMKDSYHIWLDPRYDNEAAWLDLYEQLSIETSIIQLSSTWGIDDKED